MYAGWLICHGTTANGAVQRSRPSGLHPRKNAGSPKEARRSKRSEPGNRSMDKAHNTNRPLEERLRAIEDRLAIFNLVAGHPPSADTGADYFTRAVYTEDGVIDLAADKGAHGNEAIAAMVKEPGHQTAIDGGLAHFASLPHVEVDG